MIPCLEPERELASEYRIFLEDLSQSRFEGDIASDYGERIVSSTDNSIYQIMPQAVLYPRSKQDVKILVLLLNKEKFRNISISPRGGSTGTNGQSLSQGIIVDFSRYMTSALEINHQEKWVRVEPGMIPDRLNHLVKPWGLVFAPSISTSSRATLGGMISTDASGKGSLLYGRTSDHILELECLLMDGTEFKSKAINLEELENIKKRNDSVGEIYRLVDEITVSKENNIKKLPKLKRHLTGYNLEKIYSEDRSRFNLNYLLSGSEGTLCFVLEAKLKLTPVVKHKKLLLIKYSGFIDALKDARNLIATGPAAIETIDEKILGLAKEDIIYFKIKHILDSPQMGEGMGLNFIEYTSDDIGSLETKVHTIVEKLQSEIQSPSSPASGYYLVQNEREAASLWEMRKKGVGLLANVKGKRKPIPFVEDTVVPPEKLADYIRDFRKLLDGYGLEYGMFGHVDVGCLHVRPALDMKDENDEKMIPLISDKVAELVHKYGGVMWGEHGKGFRGRYTSMFFGEELYRELQCLKAVFDPFNRLNPGKIAVPIGSGDELMSLESPTRGMKDRRIGLYFQVAMSDAMSCNGNAACLNYNPDSVMCPSSKATGNRIHSPKGRAAMIREWIRLLELENYRPLLASPSAIEGMKNHFGSLMKPFNALNKARGKYDFSHEVYEAMKGCLSCGACAGECPLKVNIPDLKSIFLHFYHKRYPRPWRELLFAKMESSIKLFSIISRMSSPIISSRPFKLFLKNVLGVVDAPLPKSPSLSKHLRKRGVSEWNPEELKYLSEDEKEKSLILIQDVFTSFLEPKTAVRIYDFLTSIGVRVYVAPFFNSGKVLHIKGFLNAFRKLAEKNHSFLKRISQYGVPLAGIEPAVTLTYQDEYSKVLEISDPEFKVHLIQEWLSKKIDKLDIPINRLMDSKSRYVLFGHCTEKTSFPPSQMQWMEIFKAFGYELKLEEVGCCGMAGVYGHETENLSKSRKIYSMSWEKKIAAYKDNENEVLASGYSCRCQVKRFEGFKLRHPLEALADITDC